MRKKYHKLDLHVAITGLIIQMSREDIRLDINSQGIENSEIYDFLCFTDTRISNFHVIQYTTDR